MIQTIITFIIVFGVLVFIHELGHFLAAKKAGVLVREFAIGFGPKIFQTRYGETTYTIRALPLGGFVMMAGGDDDLDLEPGQELFLKFNAAKKVTRLYLAPPESQAHELLPLFLETLDTDTSYSVTGFSGEAVEPVTYPLAEQAMIVLEDGRKLQIASAERQYPQASWLNRFKINIAGPLFNFLLAFVAFSGVALLQGGVPSTEAKIGEILPDTPAAVSQMEEGTVILSVEEQEVSSWQDLVTAVQARPGEATDFKFRNPSGEVIDETLIPETKISDDGQEFGQLGFQVYIEKGLMKRLAYGLQQTWAVTIGIFQVVSAMITGKLGVDQLGGPIAIFATTGEVARTSGFIGILNFLAFLSVNLGAMNLLPIPGLDGGKILLLFVEAIRRKPISKEKEYTITLIGMAFILLLMLIVTWQDISQYFWK